MLFSKESFIDFIDKLDIACIDFNVFYQAPPERTKTVDVRTGACDPSLQFKSRTTKESSKINGEISIVLSY